MLSTTLLTVSPDQQLKAETLKRFLSITHDETPIMIKIGNKFVAVREVRQVSFGPGEPVAKVLVPVDFALETK